MEKDKPKVYVYTRVSTEMQTDGYSLEAQKTEIENYAKHNGYRIIRYFSDEGYSGKNIAGRAGFAKMLDYIIQETDNISYVIVYKLSRFGRNATDTLNSLKVMQEHGVNLICIADALDSSTTTGKLIIGLMSSFSEMELENIHAQSMAGRKSKAKSGGWNGGFAPYGYSLTDGKLKICEEEAKTIKYIFDLYTATDLGANGIANRLNAEGIKKIVRQNGKLTSFTAHFVKQILDNPVYMGKIAYGRRTNVSNSKTGKISAKPVTDGNKIIIADGPHQAIVSSEIWYKAKDKRIKTGIKKEKIVKEHEYVFSGLISCPGCGRPMYGISSSKKRKDGTPYPISYAYKCRQSLTNTGRECQFHKQINCKDIDEQIVETLTTAFLTPENIKKATALLNEEVNTVEIQEKIDKVADEIKKTTTKILKYEKDKAAIDLDDPLYDEHFESINRTLDFLFQEKAKQKLQLEEYQKKILFEKSRKSNTQDIFSFLLDLGCSFKYLTQREQKRIANVIIENIEIFPTKRAFGYIKAIHFAMPVYKRRGEYKKDMTIWDYYPDILDEDGNINEYDPIDETDIAEFELLTSADANGCIPVTEDVTMFEETTPVPISEIMTGFRPKQTTVESVVLMSKEYYGSVFLQIQ